MIRLLHLATAVVAALALAGGCARAGTAPLPTGADANNATLIEGRLIYIANCARCHATSGGGGAGSRLAGKMVDKYPDVASQIEIVTKGKGGMPAWASKLTAEEIAAVVDYTRLVL